MRTTTFVVIIAILSAWAISADDDTEKCPEVDDIAAIENRLEDAN
jgi:hypothetical protein